MDDGMNEAPMEDGGPAMMGGRPMMRERRTKINSERRKELLAFALELVELVEAKTETHERCLLNSMVHAVIEER